MLLAVSAPFRPRQRASLSRACMAGAGEAGPGRADAATTGDGALEVLRLWLRVRLLDECGHRDDGRIIDATRVQVKPDCMLNELSYK